MKENQITRSDRVLSALVLKFLPGRLLPNHLTIFRFFTIPFVAILLLADWDVAGIILFAISAFTDALDGALARTRGQISDWGRTYDPLADKLLIGTAAIIMLPRYLPLELVFAIIFIEMVLIGSAYYFKNRGVVEIRANGWGKAKMVCQSFGVGFVLLFAVLGAPALLTAGSYLLYAAILFALVSLLTYGI
jgi:CDP-diacylglycerol--glycerol-3-phosphate 3-phosphatidyltransferase